MSRQTKSFLMERFREMGIEVAYTDEEALKQATVVIDCTPSGVGRANKEKLYLKHADRVKGFIAQGSEFGFGKMARISPKMSIKIGGGHALSKVKGGLVQWIPGFGFVIGSPPAVNAANNAAPVGVTNSPVIPGGP